MRGWPKADWVRIDFRGSFLCQRCGDSYPMKMPVDLDLLVAAGKAYAQKHKHCKPKEGP